MERQDQERQDVERLMRRATEMGLDPQRVARAVRQGRPAPAEPRPEMAVEGQPSPVLRVARRLARRPSGR